MIQFDDVSLGFSGHNLYEGASFSLQKGERCGLVGRNGSGKSTLFSIITGKMEPDKGRVILPKNYKIGHLEQHIHFTESTIIQEAALALPDPDHLYKAERILFGLGFTEDDLYADPNSFSGGYQLRLNLTKVLVAEPDCLLLDEPTNYLDLMAIRWLTGFLKKWPGEFILISHDREFMDQVTTHTMGLHRQKVRKIKGTTLDFFTQILQEEEIHEKTRIKVEKRKEHLQGFIDRFGAKASKAGQAESKKKMLAREPVLEKLNQMSELSFSFNEAPFPGKKMVGAEEISFSYGEDPLIDDFSLEIEKGERIAIIGKNGRGKSTLLRLLGGDLNPISGEVSTSENVRLGYFGQTHIDRLHPSHTIEEEIAAANHTLNYKEIKSISGKMMFTGDLSEKRVSVLSGGEKSRVLLGKIVAKPCNLLLLDEPTHHLDIESIEALIDAIEDFSGTVIIVTHSELILRRLALDKIVLCGEAKQTLFLGDYDEFLDSVGWEDTTKTATQPKKKQTNDRKERADAVSKKSAALKPIEQQIEATEKKLVTLEEQQKTFLINPIKEETKAAGLRQKQIEQLETELYDLYALLEKTKESFE